MKKTIVVMIFFVLQSAIAMAICTEAPGATIYSGHRGSYGSSNLVMRSRCYDSNTLTFPYCDDAGEVNFYMIGCKCVDDGHMAKCTAVLRTVFIEAGSSSSTQQKSDAIKSWINN